MKRWTRKLLAGLLSFGMLLQVASPLSALAAEAPTVESSITVYDAFSRLYTSVTYVLNRYTDGSVRWEDDKNPWDGVAVSYDTSSNTYVFSGTLSVPAEGTGHTATLICSDPQNDSIKIDGGDGVAVNTSLQIGVSDQTRGAKNVTVLANSSSTAINGSAAFDCYGDVTITNPSGAVTSQYDGIVVYDNAKDIVITGKSEAPLIGGSFSSFSRGNITIENPDGADVRTNLSIREGAAEVKLTGSDSSGLVLFRDSSLSTFKIEAKTLTMENKSGPVGPVEFTGTDTASAYRVAVGESESNNTQTALTGTTYSETVNAKYLRISTDGFVPAPVTPYGFSVNGTSVTAENAGTTLPDGMTYDKAANKLTASKDITGNLTIAADNTNATLDVALKSVNGSLTVGDYYDDTTRAQNLTINGTVTGKTYVCVTGNIEVNGTIASEQNGADGQNRLDTTTGEITVTSDGAVWGQYASVILKAADGPVKVSGNKPNEGLVGPNLTVWATEMEINNPDGKISAIVFVPQRSGDYYINESTEPAERQSWTMGNEAIFSKAVDSKLVISQTKPSIHQHTLGDWEHDETNHWKTCSGCNEKVGKAEHDFGEDGVCECGYEKPAPTPDHHQHTASTEWKYDDTNHWHTCATCNEDVRLGEAPHDFGEDGVCECGYKKPAPTPDHEHTLGDWEHDETHHWKTCTDCNKKVGEAPHNFGEDGNAEKCEDCGYANPGYVAPDPDDTGTVDSGSDGGGAVAAVLVGGAAVWGGYEIATRVILHNILPEGTAIPANRGQLALLVWNNAGRPAPVNEPVFADMDDADMAKAAQWCVEQGIMEAKTAETFKPESWTPKFKVIEVWNKAFPKQ